MRGCGRNALSCFALWLCYGTLDGGDAAEGKEARWCTLARGYILAADPTLLAHLILVAQIDDIIRHNSGL